MSVMMEKIAAQRAAELQAEGARARLAAETRRRRGTSSPRRRQGEVDYGRRLAGYSARLTIRRLDGEADRHAVERVAGRDSAEVPAGELLGAELEGELVAAMALADRTVIADPFAPTAEAVVLLRRRAEQIRAAEGGGRRRIVGRLLQRRVSH